MRKSESIIDFYKAKLNWVPDTIQRDIGHFNLFRLEPFVGVNARPVPYGRRDYFKISLIRGNNKIHYADKVVEIKKQALFFANPQVPYSWEEIDKVQSGYFCVFTPAFFYQFGSLDRYTVFHPGGTPVFELTDEQTNTAASLYERMFEELDSNYLHKYDVLRTFVFELLHFAMKLQPAMSFDKQEGNASRRISILFLELLERQFPLETPRQKVRLRSASDFSAQLGIHVNHLNRAVRETTEKTTTALIAERLLQESKILLKHSTWNISEIAYALGFTEVTHFNNFFKKHMRLAPTRFRAV